MLASGSARDRGRMATVEDLERWEINIQPGHGAEVVTMTHECPRKEGVIYTNRYYQMAAWAVPKVCPQCSEKVPEEFEDVFLLNKIK